MDVNGAPNVFFINSRNIDNPVLLLVSSGSGTDDYVFTDKYKDMRLEYDFTLVYWDYRWMCIAYDDTQKVTEYLKERFNKEKIYIMGFSERGDIKNLSKLEASVDHVENATI